MSRSNRHLARVRVAHLSDNRQTWIFNPTFLARGLNICACLRFRTHIWSRKLSVVLMLRELGRIALFYFFSIDERSLPAKHVGSITRYRC